MVSVIPDYYAGILLILDRIICCQLAPPQSMRILVLKLVMTKNLMMTRVPYICLKNLSSTESKKVEILLHYSYRDPSKSQFVVEKMLI